MYKQDYNLINKIFQKLFQDERNDRDTLFRVIEVFCELLYLTNKNFNVRIFWERSVGRPMPAELAKTFTQNAILDPKIQEEINK